MQQYCLDKLGSLPLPEIYILLIVDRCIFIFSHLSRDSVNRMELTVLTLCGGFSDFLSFKHRSMFFFISIYFRHFKQRVRWLCCSLNLYTDQMMSCSKSNHGKILCTCVRILNFIYTHLHFCQKLTYNAIAAFVYNTISFHNYESKA